MARAASTQIKTKAKSPAAAITARGVCARYGEKEVVSDMSLSVMPGESFGLIGLNGAGKTTFIKILLGLLSPSSGEIAIEGKPANKEEIRRKLVYLPEKFEPPGFLSGVEFIRFALSLYGREIKEDEIFAAAGRLAFQKDALHKRTNTYSKGMKQKIGLLSTLLTGCPIAVLDEPMSGLDPLARARVKDELKTCRKKGMTVFLSSHILADMDEICDRVAVIDEGLLKFTGTPAEIKKEAGEAFLERAFLSVIGKI